MYSMTPKFHIYGNNWEKVYTKKVFAKHFCKLVWCKRKGQTPILHTFLPVTFFKANFFYFSQQFRNRRKILGSFDTHIQILRIKRFLVILALF